MIGLFIGKFIGPVRPLLPITAGSLSMNIKSFIIIEVFSCFIWALIYTLPGYYAGKSMNFENNNTFESLWILAGIVVIFILIRYFRKKIKTQ